MFSTKDGEKMRDEKDKRLEIEAATFRRLKAHRAKSTQVQNIDLMEVAGFCRNCLALWYQEEASERELTLTKDESRKLFYGMPYQKWKEKYQT